MPILSRLCRFRFTRPSLLLCATLAVLLSAFPAVADDSDRRIVKVDGNAEVQVVPDEVELRVGIETHCEDLEACKQENDDIVAAVLSTVSRLGVERDRVQTDYLEIEPNAYRNHHDKPFTRRVRRTLVVTSRTIDRFEDLLTGILEAGATHVHGVDFRTTELRKHRDEARALAIDAAREKAEALAGRLGQGIGAPVEIRENAAYWWSGYGRWWRSPFSGGVSQNVVHVNPSAESGPAAVGRISVQATVSVTFELVGPDG